MTIDVSKIQSSSLAPGLQDLGAISDTTITYSGNIPAKGTTSTSIPLNFSTNKVISLIRINIVGDGIDTIWFPLMGNLSVYSSAGNYIMYFTVQSSATGRVVNVLFVNNVSNAIVTVPTLTITAHAHLYNFAW